MYDKLKCGKGKVIYWVVNVITYESVFVVSKKVIE